MLTGSDVWHYWMDEAKRLEIIHRSTSPELGEFHLEQAMLSQIGVNLKGANQ